jgi:hypothetical protein
MWVWDQSAGVAISPDGKRYAGYSGKGRGRNNPALQGVRGIGPLPRGRYRIGTPRTSQRTGPFVMDLFPMDATPADTRHDETGRSAFQIHGDSVRNPGTASSGCIILPRAVREAIWRSGDHVIEVVE